MFDVLRPRDGDLTKTNRATGEFSNAFVAETISGYGDESGSLTAAYIGKLRGPAGDNPSIRVVRLLARFFEVPAGYFVEDDVTERIVGQFQLVQHLHDQGVKNLAMRAAGLSPASKEALLKMIDAARALEGLPETPDTLA
ncbi:XRE family transcriptional regulator [[Kitasatospora] papulosa]|uniref:XRE family transcriptional regulator n=1 Tax=[Kitasatospora] papulosa TaxID=1464011 RepID=UPI00363AD710